ncbi:HNH endonuclease [Brevibacillus choshinensis]|uniref:HNH endonuclease n=1 Tax=Brevibacillus choshinensis TaxID=54911 RepID=UPI002E1D9772|nr:HNH endonuclease [Brevibacillus choshinensis]MED4780937.1 HNH endonuclease [Brevibacillus choshinensis]
MAHYKQDRPNGVPWVPDSDPHLQDQIDIILSFIMENFKNLGETVKEDIISELAEEDAYYKDGAVKEYYGKRYERNIENRIRAIEIHGLSCGVCEFNFKEVYGEWGKDFIEVHHLNPLSTIKNEVVIIPETDLMPVCSNCHRMLHRKRERVLSIEELKTLLKKKDIR